MPNSKSNSKSGSKKTKIIKKIPQTKIKKVTPSKIKSTKIVDKPKKEKSDKPKKEKSDKPKKEKSDETNKEQFENKVESICEQLRENYNQQKKLMNELDELKRMYATDIKLSKPNKRTDTITYLGFNQPEEIPESLRKLLKIKEELLPRYKVTALLYKYFSDNKMITTVKRQGKIIPNKKIQEIFGMNDKDEIDFYNLQTWLGKIYCK